MLKLIILILLCSLFFGCDENEVPTVNPKPDTVFVPVPNLNFEEWSPYISENKDTLWYDPKGRFWSTLNRLRLLGESGPITTTATTDAHSGNFAALLETKKFGDFTITGLLMAGEFDPSKYSDRPNFTNEGQPYTKKITNFRGYYKYFGADGDSGNIYIGLTRYDKINKRRDTIAEGILPLTDVAQYTQFDIPLIYRFQELEPDSIRLAFLSSKGGRTFIGETTAKVGSKLYIDDLEFILPGGIIQKVNQMF